MPITRALLPAAFAPVVTRLPLAAALLAGALAAGPVAHGLSAAEAVAAAEAEGLDLILMDLQMPVMDGLTAIREIRKAEMEEARPRRPIIVLSANSSPDDITASRHAGADGHLGKPIRPDVLLGALAQTMTPAG